MTAQFATHQELIQHISHYSWKEKINFFSQISQEIAEERLHLVPKILELSWVELLNQNSLNVLIKELECLKLFTKTYSLQNVRVLKDIIHRLLDLTKMKRQQIDENIVEIICTLIIQEKKASEHGQRHLFALYADPFSSLNHPTFFYGISDDDVMEEEDTQMNIVEESFSQQNSYIIEILLEVLKGCRKEVLNLILKITLSLSKLNFLKEGEIRTLAEGIQSVKDVVFHRKQVHSGEKLEVESKIAEILAHLTQNQ